MFFGCTQLYSIDFSNFTAKNVKDTSYLFYSCESLNAIELSGIETSNIINI